MMTPNILPKPVRYLGRLVISTSRSLFSGPRLTYSLTLEGLIFIAMVVSIGFAAINTGANLLYLTFAMMSSLMIVSALASWRTLRGLSIRRYAPSFAPAGEEVRFSVRVKNAKRLLHSYSLRIVDEDIDGNAVGLCYLMRLGSNEGATLEYSMIFERRGRVMLKWIRIGTRFPFGFVEKSIAREAPHEILIFPRMFSAAEFLERNRVDVGDNESGVKGHGASLYALREYTSADSARFIHWKVSAKSSTLMMREMEADDRQKASLILDNAVEPSQREQADDAFERAVSCLASVARELLDRGYQVEVITRAGKAPFDAGPGQLTRILRAMAVIELEEWGSQTPPLPRPESDSLALWFDYGFGRIRGLNTPGGVRRLETAEWGWPVPKPEAQLHEAV